MELEGKHILVTGGNGFLGKQVVKFLEKINDVKKWCLNNLILKLFYL